MIASSRRLHKIMDSPYITFTIPFAFEPSMKQIDVNELTPIQSKVLMAIRENPLFTIKELALYCQLGATRIRELIKELKEKGKIVRKGAKKVVIGS